MLLRHQVLRLRHARHAARNCLPRPFSTSPGGWISRDRGTFSRCRSIQRRPVGGTIALLPDLASRACGPRTLPTLTHFLGPAVDEADGSLVTRFHHRLAITRELIAKLATGFVPLHQVLSGCLGGRRLSDGAIHYRRAIHARVRRVIS